MINTHVHEPFQVQVGQSMAATRLLARIRGEFQELPGMKLTMDQAARLWSIDHAACRAALEQLMEEAFLEQDQFGRFKRRPADLRSKHSWMPPPPSRSSM